MTHYPRTKSAFAAATIFAVSACHTHGAAPSAEPARNPNPAASAAAAPENGIIDSDLRKAVSSELLRDKNIHAGDVRVAAQNGIVELSGTVDNPLSKERAVRIAEVVRGVRSVDNRIAVGPPPRPDPDIESDVRKALNYNAATAKMPISVHVQHGVVTLTGVITSWQEQQFAERVADGVRGVRFTQNDLTTKASTPRTAAEMSGDVESRLAWDALVEHDPITVSVKDGHVALSGRTGSAAERTRARNDAWVDGVSAVDATALLVTPFDRPDENLRTGKPPTDPQIRKAIQDAAHYDARLRAFSINPSVADGIVTLLGTVDTLRARTAAEDLARNTVGVKTVKNELTTRPVQPLADRSLEHSIGEALAFDSLTDARDIHPLANNGKVTLTGSVDSYFESAEALDDASSVVGVTRVDNQLRVRSPAEPYVYSPWLDPFTPHVDSWYVTSLRPTLSDSAITRRIRENFSWSPFIRLPDVEVSVQAGTATLTGTVSSFRERQAAVDNALEAGAVSVDDELKVS